MSACLFCWCWEARSTDLALWVTAWSILAMSLLIFRIPFPSVTKRLVLRSPTVKGACSSYRFCSVCFEVLLLGVFVFRVAMSSWCLCLSAVMKLPSVWFSLLWSFLLLIYTWYVCLFIHLHFKLFVTWCTEYIPCMKHVLGPCESKSFSSRFSGPSLSLLPWLRFLVSPLWVYFCYQRTKRWQVTGGRPSVLSRGVLSSFVQWAIGIL